MQQSNQTGTRSYSFQVAPAQAVDISSSTSRLGLRSDHMQSASHPLGRPSFFSYALDRHIRLPNNLHSFLVYLSGLLLICAGMIVHVLLSAQILQAEVRLARLDLEHDLLQQQNGELLWQIARETNLARLQDRIDALGYVPADQREYVIAPANTVGSSVSTGIDGTHQVGQSGIAPFTPNLAVIDTSPPLLQRLRIWEGTLTSDVRTEQTNDSNYSAAEATHSTAIWTNEQRQKWWQHLWEQTLERGTSSLHWLTAQ